MNNSQDYCLTLHKSLNLFDTTFAIFPLTLLPPKLPIYSFIHVKFLTQESIFTCCYVLLLCSIADDASWVCVCWFVCTSDRYFTVNIASVSSRSATKTFRCLAGCRCWLAPASSRLTITQSCILVLCSHGVCRISPMHFLDSWYERYLNQA